MSGVKLLVVLSVGTLYLTVMSWRIGTNLLVHNIKTLPFSFKQCQIFLISCLETFCESCSIIRLNFVYLERETADMDLY